MAGFNTFDDRSVARIDQTIKTVDGLSKTKRGILRHLPRQVMPKVFKTGIVYGGNIAPCSLFSVAGSGEVKFDSMKVNDLTFVLPDTYPTTVYNYSSTTFTVGARVVCYYDQTIVEEQPDGSFKYKSGWVVSDYVNNEEENPVMRYIALCNSADQTVTTDDPTVINFGSASFMNHNLAVFVPFRGVAAGPLQGIHFKTQGWFLIGYDVTWEGPVTSETEGDPTWQSTDMEQSWGYTDLRYRVIPGGTPVEITCTTKRHDVVHNAEVGWSTGGNASKTVFYRNTSSETRIGLYTRNGAATHSRKFPAQTCALWSIYLGHNLDSDATIEDFFTSP